jgi:hypothetical protein
VPAWEPFFITLLLADLGILEVGVTDRVAPSSVSILRFLLGLDVFAVPFFLMAEAEAGAGRFLVGAGAGLESTGDCTLSATL